MEASVHQGTVFAEPLRLSKERKRVDVMAIMRYSNMAVVNRYAHDHQVAVEEAHILFEETKKFLAVCASEADGDIEKMSPSDKQDQMWHTFVLHTKDYMDFCYEMFGVYLHHQPCTGTREHVSPEQSKMKAEKMFGSVAPRQWTNSKEMRCCCSYC